MNLLDEQYTRTPFYGVKRMTAYLRQLGYRVNHKRVRRLLRQMGLDAIYQRPNTSKPNPEHQVYPYLLRNVPINHRHQIHKALRQADVSDVRTPYLITADNGYISKQIRVNSMLRLRLTGVRTLVDGIESHLS